MSNKDSWRGHLGNTAPSQGRNTLLLLTDISRRQVFVGQECKKCGWKQGNLIPFAIQFQVLFFEFFFCHSEALNIYNPRVFSIITTFHFQSSLSYINPLSCWCFLETVGKRQRSSSSFSKDLLRLVRTSKNAYDGCEWHVWEACHACIKTCNKPQQFLLHSYVTSVCYESPFNLHL